MRSTNIQQLRSTLGMTSTQFANLLGVHASTIYRWEAAGDRAIKVEPMQQRILAVLLQEIEKRKTPESRAEFGSFILRSMLVGGGLFALYKVLDLAFKDKF